MIDPLDGIPEFCRIPQARRNATWAANPPKAVPTSAFLDPRLEADRVLREEQRKAKTTVRIAKLKSSLGKPTTPRDLTKVHWDVNRSCWIPNDAQETDDMATKLLIITFTKDMTKVERGCTSIAETASADDIAAKVTAAVNRGGKSVAQVWVTKDSFAEIPTHSEWHVTDGVPAQVSPVTAKPTDPERAPATAEPTATNEENTDMAKKTKAKAKSTGEKKPGVIAKIVETISRDRGASIEEIVAVLTKAFPDRKAKSMTSTAKIQANKNATSKEKDEKRGLVYYRKGRGGK